jgi:hypothetical protein
MSILIATLLALLAGYLVGDADGRCDYQVECRAVLRHADDLVDRPNASKCITGLFEDDVRRLYPAKHWQLEEGPSRSTNPQHT